MTEFHLTKDNFMYTLTVNGNIITEKQFKSDIEAINYFRNFVTSFVQAKLVVDF